MDMDNIVALKPQELENFSEEYKEDIYENVVLFNIDAAKLDITHLKNLFKLTQILLKFKDEQVKSAISELDNLATNQGIEEATLIQSLKNEIKTLKSSYKSPQDFDTKKENEELRIKIKQQKTTIKAQNAEINKLKTDITDLQEEIINAKKDYTQVFNDDESQTESETSSRYERLTENVKQKNKYISDLLFDIEALEKENVALKEQLISIKNEMQEANEHINGITNEFERLKQIQSSHKEKIINVSKENEDLKEQLEELTKKYEEKQIDLEKTTVTFTSKIDELKKQLHERETEIESLQMNNAELEIKLTKAKEQPKIPDDIFAEKDAQIVELETKLIEATEEMTKSALLLENISKSKKQVIPDGEKETIINDLKKQLEEAHSRSQDLQMQLEIAEQDAHSRSKQVCDLINQLRKYEEGQYGFYDVAQELQDFRKQINVRDKQIADLIRTTNDLQSSYNEIEYENHTLREKLGIPLEELISSKAIAIKQRKQKKLVNNLQNQIEMLEDDNIHLHAELRKHKRLLSDLVNLPKGSEFQKSMQNELKLLLQPEDTTTESEYQQKYMEVIEENEALRKGMHEILDSIRLKKENTNYEIKSETLENLLLLLDARHISGWYHPAMRLQAELQTLQGANEELRKQVRDSKQEIIKSSECLKQAEFEIEELRKHRKDDKETQKKDLIHIDETFTLPPQISSTSAGLVTKLNNHLLVVLDEYDKEVENNKYLNEKLETAKQELNIIRGQLGVFYKQYILEKRKLESSLEEALVEKKALEKTVDIFEKDETDQSIDSADISSNLKKQYAITARKCIYLEETEKRLLSENARLKSELCSTTTQATERIKDLEANESNLKYKIIVLEKTLCDSIPKGKYEITNEALNDLTIKYQKLLDNENKFNDSNNTELLRKEIEILITEKDTLLNELMVFKLKMNCVKNSNESFDEINKKLTISEMNELREKQNAEHLKSLYQLVKEQLRKTEERCMEIERYNKTILSDNIQLQIREKDMQDKLANVVLKENFLDLENKYHEQQNSFQELKNKYQKLLNRTNVREAELKTLETIKSNYDTEFINMKHLILDLQSQSDEKSVIARLNSEVVLARMCENDMRTKLENLKSDHKQLSEEFLEKEKIIEDNQAEKKRIHSSYALKIRNLEQIINTLRTQYLGCSPVSTKERVITILQQLNKDKSEAFKTLRNFHKTKNELFTLQEQVNNESKNLEELRNLSKTDSNNIAQNLLEWYKEKNAIQAQECKSRRNAEFKEMQIQQLLERIKNQDHQLIKLEEEYLKLNNLYMSNNLLINITEDQQKPSTEEIKSSEIQIEKKDVATDVPIFETKLFNSVQIQTEKTDDENKKYEEIIQLLRKDIQQNKQIITQKENILKKQESHITELKTTCEKLKEKIMELETNLKENKNALQQYDSIKTKLEKQLEEITKKYETQIKKIHAEHDSSTAGYKEKIQELERSLQNKEKLYEELQKTSKKRNEEIPSKVALEEYVTEVHKLESHMAELETKVSSLNTQLQASREESVRWRTLANSRLDTIENLRKEFDGRYQEELSTYKAESDKYMDETISLKQEITKLKIELNQKDVNINEVIHVKDIKIQELNRKILHLQNELKILSENSKSILSSEYSDLKLSKELLENEYEALKKRFDQVMVREKTAKAEINQLKAQLLKRPVLPVKFDRTEKSIKEQLQKKINLLEKELEEVRQKLEKELAQNETRKVKIAEDFTLWEKQKRWQQTAEKYKEKFTAKSEELENLQRNHSSAKSLISRLEREKHILEGKLKSLKSSNAISSASNINILEQENMRLKNELDMVTTKLEMQQYHAGGLGAAMLQDKLEAQERKIAVLELSSKGSTEITLELERLNNLVSSLQKTILRLESENLELSVDLKKVTSEAPYLREQIQHLERYIDVLKSEHVVTSSNEHFQGKDTCKNVTELEKTVLSLKRLIERLQSENKRLQNLPSASVNSKKDKTQIELNKLRQQCDEQKRKIVELENNLVAARKRLKLLEEMMEKKEFHSGTLIMEEYQKLQSQLEHKNQLLSKVKILLQKAVLKEKYLQEEIKQLKQKSYGIPEDGGGDIA